MPIANERKLRVGFVPYSLDANEYCARMMAILARLATVEAVPDSTLAGTLAALRRRRRLDLAFVSWFENRMLDAHGSVSALRLCKVILRTLWLRAHARKLIFIRHNRMPHATRPSHRPVAQRLVDLYERLLFEGSLTHSPAEASSTRLYCPHPLYEHESTAGALSPQLAAFSTKTFYVVFGRIEPYKQLEQLIRAFPKHQQLVICGRCSDPDYLSTLMRAAPENVTVLYGTVSDAEAQWLIRRSQGLVINHASDDMIVSASFFYAMSLTQRVYAVETPFMRWVSGVLGDDLVMVSPDLERLCESLSAAPSGGLRREHESAVQQLFGDDTVARYLEAALERSGLDVRVMESSSGAKSHAVCSSQRGDGALRS